MTGMGLPRTLDVLQPNEGVLKNSIAIVIRARYWGFAFGCRVSCLLPD